MSESHFDPKKDFIFSSFKVRYEMATAAIMMSVPIILYVILSLPPSFSIIQKLSKVLKAFEIRGPKSLLRARHL
ncbi:hypothetical protein D3C87_1798620 [compost metagenome]